MNSIYIILFLIVIYFVFMTKSTEKFTREINTAAATVDNYFTDLQCIDPTLPIARFRQGNTLEYYSLDGTNPMMMSDFGVPNNVVCFKDKSDRSRNPDFNTYISKDGVRNRSSGSYKLFKDLGQNKYPNYQAINCTPNGLNDPNHPCGKLFNALTSHPTYCPTEEFAKNPDCTNIQDNKSKATGIDNPVNMISYNDINNIFSKQKCQSVNCLRRSGAPPSVPLEPPSVVPDSNGNCDSVSVSRGRKKIVKGGDINCLAANELVNSYASTLSEYNNKLTDYTTKFNTCLSSCDNVSTNIPNARYCNGSNNVMSYIGNNSTC
jgi:hypothetical protein